MLLIFFFNQYGISMKSLKARQASRMRNRRSFNCELKFEEGTDRICLVIVQAMIKLLLIGPGYAEKFSKNS